jgi:hypothetical protein
MPSIVKLNVTQQVGAAPATLQQTGALISQGATTTSAGSSTLLTQVSDLTAILTGAKAITSAVLTAGTVTVTCTTAHGFTVGDTLYLTIAGVAPTGYNGTFLCTVTTSTQFTYALSGSLASGTGGVYTPEDVAELVAMVNTYFAQGAINGVYVLELGAGNANDGVAALTSYLNANPNVNYTAGAAGYYYAYLVPRTWDANANFLALVAQYESPTSQTYFFVTTTLGSYTAYTNLMKCVYATIESPNYGVYGSNALTAISWSGGIVTATTTTAHGVVPGNWFTIVGCTPTGYNVTAQALPGTGGTTLLYALATNPGTETVLGTLQASLYANAGVPVTEFSAAAVFYQFLVATPSAAALVPPFAYRYVYGVTPFPSRGNNTLQQTLKTAGVNIIGTGAEGGISLPIILWGTMMDGHDATYWYSVDWVQINANLRISNAIINGSNNTANPLYYNQAGINRLLAVAQGVMNTAIAYGLALSPVTVNAVPFAAYLANNPTDYPAGIYNGLSVTYTPQRGFITITFNIAVSSFPTAA